MKTSEAASAWTGKRNFETRVKKAERIYEPHLAVREFSVPPGGEWAPRSPGWSLIKIERGTGYFLQPQSSLELETGTALLVAGPAQGSIRASQLGGLFLYSFSVTPTRLTGLITMGEQDFLEQAACRKEFSLRLLPPGDPVAVKMGELCASGNSGELLFRLNLLQLFVEVFGNELRQATSNWESADARQRLQLLLERTPSAELLEMSFDELARRTHCTSRHLSRLFHELVGMSFRDKRAELRLTRARDLLATSKSKVVEVALESGYKSLSLFNLMFTRHFGTSPGRWRQKYRDNSGSKIGRNKRVQPFAV
jgi:AraC-like DNA-binding protein